MKYIDVYNALRSKINYNDNVINFDGITVYNFTYKSKYYRLLPGAKSYECFNHQITFNEEEHYFNNIVQSDYSVNTSDFYIKENRAFRYHIFKPQSVKSIKKIIFMFHGFNEKSWDKYFPWAYKLAIDTDSTIVLFPIAFHMNRAPLEWSDKRKMFRLSESRKEQFPNVIDSSFSNVAISTRLQSMPQRFIWSGLQTYYDVIDFIETCKLGNHPLIDKNFSFDFFAYSIGCLLAQILILTNHNNYFKDSKLCMFCGGTVFNRMSPVTKPILDSEANVELYSYLVEHIDKHKKNDIKLNHFLGENHREGYIFYSMLNYRILREFRESLFRQCEDRLFAISLANDSVMPPYEIINTLQGAKRDINIPVDIYDFNHKYSHETPFVSNQDCDDLVDKSFNDVFNNFVNFYKK